MVLCCCRSQNSSKVVEMDESYEVISNPDDDNDKVRALVLFDYHVTEFDELTVFAGEVVDNVEVDLGWKGWVKVTIDDRQGFIPESYLAYLPNNGKQEPSRRGMTIFKARVVIPSKAEYEGELGLPESGVVEVIDTCPLVGPGWWEGRCRGKYGFFPAHFVDDSEDYYDFEGKENLGYDTSSQTGEVHIVNGIALGNSNTDINNIDINQSEDFPGSETASYNSLGSTTSTPIKRLEEVEETLKKYRDDPDTDPLYIEDLAVSLMEMLEDPSCEDITEQLDCDIVEIVLLLITNASNYALAHELLAAKLSNEMQRGHVSENVTRCLKGACYEREGRFGDAVEQYEEGWRRRMGGGEDEEEEEDARVLVVGEALAVCLMKDGKFQEASQVYEDILKAKGDQATEHYTMDTKEFMAVCAEKTGNHKTALDLFMEVFIYRKAKLRITNTKSLEVGAKVGECLIELHEYSNAKDILHDILKAVRSSGMGVDDPFCLRIQHNIAVCLENLGSYEEAVSIYQQVYAIDQTKIGATQETMATQKNIAMCMWKHGNHQGSLDMYRKVYNVQCAGLGVNHPSTLKTKERMDRCLQKVLESEEAL